MVVRDDRTHFSLAESLLVGGHLAAARRMAGVCPGALARRLKIPEATLHAYEAGRIRLPVRLVFAAARALSLSPYQLLVGRSDRVLNPWGPTLDEWQRVWRRADSPPVRSIDEGERRAGSQVWAEASDGADVPHGGDDESVGVLTGQEAARAMAFLDEPDPAGRFEDGEEEW